MLNAVNVVNEPSLFTAATTVNLRFARASVHARTTLRNRLFTFDTPFVHALHVDLSDCNVSRAEAGKIVYQVSRNEAKDTVSQSEPRAKHRKIRKDVRERGGMFAAQRRG